MAESAHPLETRIGYRFRDRACLRQALTHRSAGVPHNERLEFLGDAVLGLVVADLLGRRFPDAAEGELSRLRARLVRQPSLARVARDLDLGAQLRLGAGEKASGGHERESILADAVEALLGALYLDGGLDTARRQAEAWLAGQVAALGLADGPPDTRDAKTCLQEYLQAHNQPLPDYQVIAMSGKPHQRHFRVQCQAAGLPAPTLGEGRSRRIAEQEAAARALAQLEAGT